MLSFFSRIIIVIIVIIIVNIEVTGGTIKVQRRCIHYYGGTVVCSRLCECEERTGSLVQCTENDTKSPRNPLMHPYTIL